MSSIEQILNKSFECSDPTDLVHFPSLIFSSVALSSPLPRCFGTFVVEKKPCSLEGNCVEIKSKSMPDKQLSWHIELFAQLNKWILACWTPGITL